MRTISICSFRSLSCFKQLRYPKKIYLDPPWIKIFREKALNHQMCFPFLTLHIC